MINRIIKKLLNFKYIVILINIIIVLYILFNFDNISQSNLNVLLAMLFTIFSIYIYYFSKDAKGNKLLYYIFILFGIGNLIYAFYFLLKSDILNFL